MKFLLRLLLLAVAFNLTIAGQTSTPDLILFNGKIFTSDPSRPDAEAVAVSGDKIMAVGSDAEVMKLATVTTRLIDLKGNTVIPGVNDAHFHFSPHPEGVDIGFESMEPSWAEVVAAIQNAIKHAPKGKWIFVTVGGDVMADVKADCFSLDQIALDNPVVINTYYGHGQILNSMAMSRLSITEAQADPMGGYFERDVKTKKLNGRLWEYAQWRQDRKLADMVSDDEVLKGLKSMAGEAAAFGVTSLQVMSTLGIDRFVRLLEKAKLPVRVRAMPFSLTTAKGRDTAELGVLSKLKPRDANVTVGGYKWILDGTPFEHGAALRKPYSDRSAYAGKLNFPEAEIARMVNESLTSRQQLLVHCAGDRPIEGVFLAMAKQQNINWPSKRLRIEHGDGMTKDLIPTAKNLGVVVIQNPTHLSLADMIYSRYSPQRGFFTLRSLIDAGVPFALGSDGLMNPYLNIMLASINPAVPTEAITREQAVTAYTTGSAFAEFAEKKKGSLSVGKLADLTVLSQDIFEVPLPELPKTHSVTTFLGGKVVFETGELK